MAKSHKHRNAILGRVAKEDPKRFRARVVESEKRKCEKNRARRKAEMRRDMKDE